MSDNDEDPLEEIKEKDADKVEKHKVYSNIPHRDYQWIDKKADEIGGTKAEAIRRLIHEARIRENFGDEKLL